MNATVLFWLMLRASLLSNSGLANLPALHADLVVARGWATDSQFAEALAVGQVSPGPNGLWVVSLGYLMDGLRGATLAVVAICLPPLLVIPLGRIVSRAQDHPAMDGFLRGLSAAVIGVFVVALGQILGSGDDIPRSAMIAVAALALCATGRIPVLLILALAAGAGVLGG